jgi:subtilase family serine protease
MMTSPGVGRPRCRPPSLASGQSVDLSFPIPPGCFSPDCGFRITVDANGDVVEANEANNTASGTCIG